MMVQRRHLIGRTIVDFKPNAQREGGRGTVHEPVITLDDGSVLVFMAEERENDYGVQIIRVPAKRAKKRSA